MKIIIIDSSTMERRILSDFLSDQGFKVETFDRLSSRLNVLNDGEAPPCVVILGVSGAQNQGLLKVAEVVAAYPCAPIILLADRTFCMDAHSPHIETIQAIVRRPVQLEELEWILRRLSRAKQAGANRQ